MALDGFSLRALVAELGPLVADSRVTRIHQPARDEIALQLYHRRRDMRLVLSANPRWARIAVEPSGGDNPPAPPPFCMVLRKHLDGARLVGLSQDGLERIVTLTFSVRDELGDLRTKRLLLEIMGRHSNILLVDDRDQIIDASRRVADEEAPRPLLPGLPYTPPPRPTVPDALTVDAQTLGTVCAGADGQLADALRDGTFGLSPLLAREVCVRADVSPRMPATALGEADVASVHAALAALRQPSAALRPQVVALPDGRREFSAFDLTQYDNGLKRFYPDVNSLILAVLTGGRRAETLAVQQRALGTVLKRELDRCQRKHAKQLEEAAAGREADEHRVRGELILANLHSLAKRMTQATLVDYAGNERTIPLDPSLTPSENAQACFKRYNRAKKAAVAAAEQAARTADEIAYLEQVNLAVDQAGAPDLAEIRAELAAQGYISAPPTRDGKAKASEPRRLLSVDGLEILVGRNSAQNDLVTMKLANPGDLWLHAKDMPGSHVILRTNNRRVPESSLEQAATLAAYFSRGRDATKVAIDYTERRHVRKVPGARPGMVIYDHQRTVLVEPKAPEGVQHDGDAR